ncbi:unnamed protein product [Brachionus calyciflorus]|uniref:EF-hand domain-containing protein n=1 Tax=Brachionus calyciflorus TaxID=104777 RepID=A0A814KQL1_9BILA|nr:unnamed protein product [Brachionus calyciflorus]
MSVNEFRSIAGADNRIGIEEYVAHEIHKNPYKNPYDVRKEATEKFNLIDRDHSARIEYNEFHDATNRLHHGHYHYPPSHPSHGHYPHPPSHPSHGHYPHPPSYHYHGHHHF